MIICVITYYCKVVVGPGAQLCTLLEVWVLGVGIVQHLRQLHVVVCGHEERDCEVLRTWVLKGLF